MTTIKTLLNQSVTSNKKRLDNSTFALSEKARWVRLQVLEKIFKTGKGHIGGTFSCIDLLVALYYSGNLKINLKNSDWKNRDRFILSKGHACLALYVILMDLGIIDKKTFDSYSKDGGLGGQLDINIAGVDFNTGSLGHSIGVAAGMALAAKMDSKDYKVVTLVGDSEFFEGAMWEGIAFAKDYNLNNLVVIVDRNGLMVTDYLEDEGLYNLFSNKIKNFGWEYFELNGHSFEQISKVFDKIKESDKPILIMANTIRGKGISFVENNIDWYTRVPTAKEYKKAVRELKRETS